MTNTKPDLKPNERKVLDALIALGEATAAKVGEQAGLAYPTTTPKLRKLEALGLAEKFNNDASQTLWRATRPAAGNDDGAKAAAQATTPTTDEPEPHDGPGAAEANGAAPSEPAPAAPETGETARQTPAAPPPASAAGQPAEPEAAEPEAAEPEAAEPEAAEPEAAEPEAVEPEAVEPEAVEPDAAEGEDYEEFEPEGPADDALNGVASTAAGPATTGDEAPTADAGEDTTAPAAAPKAKRKRPAGALEASVLAILQGDPDGQYKINDLRKRVDKADEATGYPAASAGAIANALDKLTGKGQVISIPAKHATFQATPSAG